MAATIILLCDILVGVFTPPCLCTHLPKTTTRKSFRANPTDCPNSAKLQHSQGTVQGLCMWVFKAGQKWKIDLLDLLLPIRVYLSLICLSSSFLFASCSLSLPYPFFPLLHSPRFALLLRSPELQAAVPLRGRLQAQRSEPGGAAAGAASGPRAGRAAPRCVRRAARSPAGRAPMARPAGRGGPTAVPSSTRAGPASSRRRPERQPRPGAERARRGSAEAPLLFLLFLALRPAAWPGAKRRPPPGCACCCCCCSAVRGSFPPRPRSRRRSAGACGAPAAASASAPPCAACI